MTGAKQQGLCLAVIECHLARGANWTKRNMQGWLDMELGNVPPLLSPVGMRDWLCYSPGANSTSIPSPFHKLKLFHPSIFVRNPLPRNLSLFASSSVFLRLSIVLGYLFTFFFALTRSFASRFTCSGQEFCIRMTSSNEHLTYLPGGGEVSARTAQKVDQALNSLNSQSASPRWLVQDVAAGLPSGAPQEGSDSPVPFFHILERLKTTPREGWRRFGKKNGESISDHMYRMAMMTMFAPEPLRGLLDIQRCTNMALIHDMAEALVGDITPVEGISKEEKNRRETTTMDFLTMNILGKVDGGRIAQNIRSLWQEYEDGVTLESKFVHDLDKIELILQMVEYERASACKCDLGEFTWVYCKILLPETKAWAKTILDEREELWGGREHVSYTAIEDPEDIMEIMLGKSYRTVANNIQQNGTKPNGSS